MNKITVGDYHVTEKAKQLIAHTLNQNRLTYGPLSKQFEKRFAQMHDCQHAILCSSGTDALRIALRALKIDRDWPEGARIALPAVTFVATLNVIIDEGFKPLLIDIDPVHYHINPWLLEDTIKDYGDVVAVIPVHLFGQPVQYRAIKEIAQFHNLAILEDSCECMLAKSGKVSVGSMGNMAAFSTYAAHLVTTGVGGIVTTNDPMLAALARSLANHGRDGIYISIDDDKEFMSEVIKKRFSFRHRGFSSRITELQAAVGLAQLDTLEQDIAQRQRNALAISTELAELKQWLRVPTVRAENSHSFMMYPIVLRSGSDKWGLINYLEENGIETREMLPLTNQPAYPWINEDEYPVAKTVNEQGFYIGCHQYIEAEDIKRIGEVFRGWGYGG